MKRILVCVLDWGLGHATRCVPVIRELQRQGAEVFLASSGSGGIILKLEFPSLSYHELPGYQPQYLRHGFMMLSMAFQLPKFIRTMRLEQKEVDALVRSQRIDAIISDNRYGCYSRALPSVLITHQVQVRLLPGFGVLEKVVNNRLNSYLRNFYEIWVPDQKGSGLTDHFVPEGSPVRYIGWLSRFANETKPIEALPVMAIVSGPEPQRTIFAEKLRTQLRKWPAKSLLVTGLPGVQRHEQDGNVSIVNHLSTAEMEARLRAADIVIARSGYSTIMDLMRLGKRAAFVPTPGQPEQIHLATLLKVRGIAFCQDQENFAVNELVEQSSRYRGWTSGMEWKPLLEPAIKQLLS